MSRLMLYNLYTPNQNFQKIANLYFTGPFAATYTMVHISYFPPYGPCDMKRLQTLLKNSRVQDNLPRKYHGTP